MLITDAFVEYLLQFHCTRDYFECHEILEEYWKSLPTQQSDALWVGLIQVAVAQYHHRRGNLVGAERMYNSAINIILNNKHEKIGIDLDHLYLELRGSLNKLDDVFEDINMLIMDSELKNRCNAKAASLGLIWGIDSSSVSLDIKDKHKRRDRSDVIAEREQSLLIKRKSRETNDELN